MSKHINVLLWIPLLFSVLFFTFQMTIIINEKVEFEQFVLEKQANYASDSAIDELLVASDISTDYGNGDFMKVEPSLALEDFAHTLCLDLGYIPTEYNLNLVKQENIRVLMVCAYDGLYANYKMRTETHAHELHQTPKLPYFYTDKNSGTQYCLTFNPEKGYWDYFDGDTYKLHDYDIYDNPPSLDVQKTAINDRIANVLNWALYETYEQDKNEVSVELPALAETIKGEQPIEGPAVIAVVDGNKRSFKSAITAESIAGSQIEEADLVMAYTFDGSYVVNGIPLKGKYYAYNSWWEKHPDVAACGKNGAYYDTVFDAARAGYNDLNLYYE